VLMLADMGLVQWHLSRKTPFAALPVRLILKSKKARQQFPDKNVDDICRSVLKKHRETVTLMGFTPTHLSLAIGMLNGVFKERWTWKAKSSGSYRLLFYYSHSPSSVL